MAKFVSTRTANYSSSAWWPRLNVTYERGAGDWPGYVIDDEQLSDRSEVGVNVANGNLLLAHQDLHVRGRGLDLNLGRAYNSQGAQGRALPAGWTLSAGGDVRLEDLPRDGSVVFYDHSGHASRFGRRADGTYASPDALDARLTRGTDHYELVFHRTRERLRFTLGGYLVSHRDAFGNAITYSYRSDNRLGSIQDTQGRTTRLTYNGQGLLETVTDRDIAPGDPDPQRVLRYAYDAAGRLSTYTDADGKQTRYGYNSGGLLDRITDARGHETRIGYNTDGRVETVTRITDAAAGTGPTTRYAYANEPGALPCTSDHAGRTTVTDPRGHDTSHCWDHLKRARMTKDAEGHTRRQTYTKFADVERFTASTGAETTGAYDAQGRLESLTQPAATGNTPAVTRFGYAERAADDREPSSTTDPQLNVMKFTYSAGRQRTAQESTSAKPQTKINYHDGELNERNDGTIASSEDGEANQTTYTYDTQGNLTTVDPPGSKPHNTLYTYDSMSRPKTITDGKGQQRVLTYDALDRIRAIDIRNPDGSLWRTDSYEFDANGNQTSRTDGEGTRTYHYDARNLLVEEKRSGTLVTGYDYDPNGNLASLTTDGESTLFGYDRANRRKTIQEPGAATPITFSYSDPGVTPETRTTSFPNGVTETVTLDPAGRPASIRATNGTDMLTSFKYSFTSGGTERDLLHTAEDTVLSAATGYSYDALNRLSRAETTGSRSDTWAYQYDNASNRTLLTHDTATTSYGYDSANQLCWRAEGTHTASCGAPPAGAVTYDHDDNGSLSSSSQGLALAYNPLGQTTSITPPGAGAVTFAYAGQTQVERTRKLDITYTNTLLGLTAETSSTATTRFTRDGKGDVLGQRTAGGRFYYLKDQLGSIVAVTDQNGQLAKRLRYNDPYGADITTTGPSSITVPHRFAGEYHDAETGLYKIGQRYYDPTHGRWTQPDPLNQVTDPRQANRYAYVGGDPINLNDPTGEGIRDVLEGADECTVVTGGLAVLGGLFGSALGPLATAQGIRVGVTAGVAYCAIRTINTLNEGRG
jgi:RHS repeat-associated protein